MGPIVCLSVADRPFADLADEDTNSILTVIATRDLQGNVGMQVVSTEGQILNQ